MVAGEAVAWGGPMITIDLDGGEGTVTDGARTVTVELCDDHDGCCVLWLGADTRHVTDESEDAAEVIRVASEMLTSA